jgi:sugar lactone lactonase YvrE
VIISPESIPFPPTNGPSPASVKRFPFKTPLQPPVGTNRFNEAAVDPQGRFLAGTMGHRIGDFDGTLYVRERDENGNYIHKTLVKGLTCSNGMDWTEDGKTM